MAKVDSYQEWRNSGLATSWSRFSDSDIDGRDVLDFGCGNGPLTLFLAATRKPRSIVGVDLYADAIARAEAALAAMVPPPAAPVAFRTASADRMPVDDDSADTILAFDCLEHVMEPEAVLAEWARVLRPGGKVLIEWFPFAGPHGPHMDSLIPLPWAHHIFGQRALFETCQHLYDDAAFQPRHWDLDADGNKLPNKWRQWRSFAAQGYVNELTTSAFRQMVARNNLEFVRFERFGLLSNRPGLERFTRIAANLPGLGEYFTSHVIIELRKAAGSS